MSEHIDYIEESEDYATRGGETPITGEDITGADGALVMAIPAVRYPAGKTATARDADLTAGNIKDGVTIFGKLGTHAPEDGDDILGAEGALTIPIVPANYPAGKTATARDADLTAGNIKDGVTIFGIEGTLVAETVYHGAWKPMETVDDGFISGGNAWNQGSLYLSIGDGGGTARESCIRFRAVDIPAAATITEAFLRITAYASQAGTGCNIKCHFNAADDAVAPTSYAEFIALVLTPGTEWNNLEAWVIDNTYDTPSLKTEVQAVVDRGGWEVDQAMTVVLKNNASTLNARRSPCSCEKNLGSFSVELHVTWTE